MDVVRAFMSSLRRQCVCALKENAHLCHPFIQRSDRVNQWERNRKDDSV